VLGCCQEEETDLFRLVPVRVVSLNSGPPSGGAIGEVVTLTQQGGQGIVARFAAMVAVTAKVKGAVAREEQDRGFRRAGDAHAGDVVVGGHGGSLTDAGSGVNRESVDFLGVIMLGDHRRFQSGLKWGEVG
jgi:hypothetical protein